MNMIFCADKNYGIGKDNQMLFNLKTDLLYFKEKTIDKVVVMGYNTFLSLPNSKPLKNRINIILTSKNIKIDNAIVVHTKDELFNTLKNYNSEDIFIIGGASIYNLLLPYCKKIYCTKVDAEKFATVFAPNLDETHNIKLIKTSKPFTENGLTFKFLEYENENTLPY